MFKLLFVKNTKTIGTILKVKKFQGTRNTLHKSSLSKSKNTHGKHNPKSNEEVFFPPVKLAGIHDKIALVTGGAEGIGLKCVRELLSCGIKGVMIADANATQGCKVVADFSKEYGADKVAFIQINPCNYMLLKNAFICTISHYKSLHIVINTIKFKDMNWEDQVDEFIKGIVLSTQLSLELMGRNNGGNGGTVVNIASSFKSLPEACPLYVAVEDFVVRFDRCVASTYFDKSDIKVLTICRATLDSVGCDLATVITKGSNGCVWVP